MKKFFKIFGIIFLLFLTILIVLPFAFQSQIKEIVQRYINENLEAKVTFNDVSLSFLSSFPQAQVTVEDLKIATLKPFQDETLATVKDIAFAMPIKELFKSANQEPIVVNSIQVNEALLSIKINEKGAANYNITKTDSSTTETNNQKSFQFKINDYTIKNSALTYIDEQSKTHLYISELNHSGNGIFSGDISELETKSQANVSFKIDSTEYLSNNQVKLDAVLGLDLKNQKYTFKNNKAFINQLPITFKGFVQLLDDGQLIDLSFENPGSSFKDFLAVIPKQYAKNLETVKTTGNFKVSGEIKGKNTDKTIPKFNISMVSNNASFQYPNLPKGVNNINIKASVKNDNGNIDNTYVDIDALKFKIDEDVFQASGSLKNLTKNMLVHASIKGVLNLANISKAYPITFDKKLTGKLEADVDTNFDYNAIENNAYQRIKNNGVIKVSDFVFSSEDVVNPIHIKQANLSFKPGTVLLNQFNAKTANSDLQATGTITNLLGFLLSDKNLQGNFKVQANNFVVNDFMVPNEKAAKQAKSAEQSLKIPAFLDCTIQADAKTVLYDNLNLKNVTGILEIKDEKAVLKNMTSNLFDGDIGISGLVNTQEKTPTFNLQLGINSFDIAQSFTQLDLLQNLAPIAKAFQGKFNTNLNLSGKLNQSFSPDLKTVSGNALAELLTTNIEPKNQELFNRLNQAISFIDFKKLNLKDIKTKLQFENGKVNVSPFNLKYNDIDISISGSHGFDKTMNYQAVFNVPAKYLGSEVNRLIGKINDSEVNQISIPVTTSIGGTFSSPNVSTDLTSSVKTLTNKLIEIEKQKLINKGKDKINDLLNDIIPTNPGTENPKPTEADSTQNKPKDPISNTIEEGVNDVLGNIFGKKKKKKDSI